MSALRIEDIPEATPDELKRYESGILSSIPEATPDEMQRYEAQSAPPADKWYSEEEFTAKYGMAPPLYPDGAPTPAQPTPAQTGFASMWQGQQPPMSDMPLQTEGAVGSVPVPPQPPMAGLWQGQPAPISEGPPVFQGEVTQGPQEYMPIVGGLTEVAKNLPTTVAGGFAGRREAGLRGAQLLQQNVAPDAAAKIEPDLKKLAELRKKLEAQGLDPDEVQQMGILAKGVQMAVESIIPGWLVASLYGGAPGAAGGAVVGGAVGAAGGAAVGAGIGYGAGTLANFGMQGAGDIYQTGIDLGATPEQARQWALLGAIPYAALEQMQMKGITGPLLSGAGKTAEKGLRRRVQQAGMEYLKTGAKETAEEALQKGVEQAAAAGALVGSGQVERGAEIAGGIPGAMVQEAQDVAPGMFVLPLPGAAKAVVQRQKDGPSGTPPLEPPPPGIDMTKAPGATVLPDGTVTMANPDLWKQLINAEIVTPEEATALQGQGVTPESVVDRVLAESETPDDGGQLPAWTGAAKKTGLKVDADPDGRGTVLTSQSGDTMLVSGDSTTIQFGEGGSVSLPAVVSLADPESDTGGLRNEDVQGMLPFFTNGKEFKALKKKYGRDLMGELNRIIRENRPVEEYPTAPERALARVGQRLRSFTSIVTGQEFGRLAEGMRRVKNETAQISTQQDVAVPVPPVEQGPAGVEAPAGGGVAANVGVPQGVGTTSAQAPPAPVAPVVEALPEVPQVEARPPATLPPPTVKESLKVAEPAPTAPQAAQTPAPTQSPAQQPIAPQGATAAAERAQEDMEATEEQSTTGLDQGAYPVAEVPLDQISLSKDVPQFKEDASAAGVVEKLGGSYERLGTAPIVLWKRINGKLEVITGRHRLDLARRTGETTIPSQTVSEADGFTKERAIIFDAEANIRDGQGSLRDYAHFFRSTPYTLAGAETRGLVSRGKSKLGFDIGRNASDDLYTLWRNREISDAKIGAIVTAAGNNHELQAVGVRFALDNPRASADAVGATTKAFQHMQSRGIQEDMFGNATYEDSVQEAQRRAAIALSKQKAIEEQLRILKIGKVDPVKARSLGITIDVKDPASLEAAKTKLSQDLERWRDWPQFPDLVREVVGDDAAETEEEAQDASQEDDQEGLLFSIQSASDAISIYGSAEKALRAHMNQLSIVRREGRMVDDSAVRMLDDLAKQSDNAEQRKSARQFMFDVIRENRARSDEFKGIENAETGDMFEPEQGSLFSTASETDAQDTASPRVHAVVTRAIRQLSRPDAPVSVTVVASDEELPNSVRPSVRKQRAQGKRINGFYDPATGGVFASSADIAKSARERGISVDQAARELWFHEAGLHHGLRALYPNVARRNAMLQRVHDSVGRDALVAELGTAYPQGNRSDADYSRLLAEEHMAKIAEEAATEGGFEKLSGRDRGILRRMYQAVRSFLRRIGVLRNFSDTDVRGMTAEILRGVRDGRGTDGEVRFIAESTRPPDTPATGNRGAFDPDNPDIRFSATPESRRPFPENPQSIALPELVRLVRESLGDVPTVVKALRRGALGMFRHKGDAASIRLLKTVSIGPRVFLTVVKNPTQQVLDEIFAKVAVDTGIDPDKLEIRTANKGSGTIVEVFQRDPNYAAMVLAHEIGHMADWLPDKTMARGNLLGRIASMRNYMEALLGPRPGAETETISQEEIDAYMREAAEPIPGGWDDVVRVINEVIPGADITPADIIAIWNSIESVRDKNPGLYRAVAAMSADDKKRVARHAMRGIVDPLLAGVSGGTTVQRTVTERVERPPIQPTKAQILARFKKKMAETIKERGLFEDAVIRRELKALTQWWRPFDENADKKYTAYRHSGKELYAEAISVLFNNPDALLQRAPEFYRALSVFMEKKGEFFDNYTAVQELIGRGEEPAARLDYDFAMMRAAEAKHDQIAGDRKNIRERWTLKNIMRDMAYRFWNNAAYLPKDAQRFIQDIVYSNGKVHVYGNDMHNKVVVPLYDAGLGIDHLGVYLLNRRARGERAELFNPGGASGQNAQGILDALKERIGDNAYAVLEDAARAFTAIRKEHVVPLLAKSGMFTPELMEKIANNDDYATFSVLEYMDATLGGNSQTAKIYHQIGTLKDVDNPYYATIHKDVMLMHAAQVNIGKRSMVAVMRESDGYIKDAEKKWDGRRMAYADSADRRYGTVRYREGGELRAVNIDARAADLFEAEPIRTGYAFRALQLFTVPLKGMFTSYNPAFGLWNVQRDFRAAVRHLPKVGYTKLLWRYAQTAKSAAMEAFTQKMDPFARELYKNNLLIVGRTWSAFEQDGAEHELERITASFDLDPATRTGMLHHAFRAVFNDFNQFLERWTKFASAKHMESLGYSFDSPEMKQAIRELAGSPDFLARGTATKYLNSIFIFSNASVQGTRAALRAFKNNPVGYSLKMAAYTILPAMIQGALESGALSGGDDDDDGFFGMVQNMFRRIPEYEKMRRLVIPVAWHGNAAGYVPLPIDHIGEIVHALTRNMIASKDPTAVSSFTSLAAQTLPWSSENLNPVFELASDAIMLAGGVNPQDSFRGGPVIDRTIFEAGGPDVAGEFAKYAWNQTFGSVVFRFDRPWTVSEKPSQDKIPVLSPVLRRFYRVSDRGLSEESRFAETTEERATAQQRKAVKEWVTGLVRDGEQLPKNSVEWKNAYKRGQYLGVMPDGYSENSFRSLWRNADKVRNPD